MNICGVISNSGPNGEPLACGYPPDHAEGHSWGSLPTFVNGRPEAVSSPKTAPHPPGRCGNPDCGGDW